MKTLITLLITLLISISSFAQQGINYKAVLKDGSGNILSMVPVNIQFTIYDDATLTNNVYQESHTINTDVNGLIIVNIGEGPTGDDFSSINWGDSEHWLDVQVNTGSGLVPLGATPFKTVPYALNAYNVNGLVKITENDGATDKTGWRLKGMEADDYAPIGINAVDLSYSPIESEENGAKGDYSFAAGYNSKAINQYSVALRGGKASGFGAIAIGGGTDAASYAGMAVGEFNVGNGNPASWQLDDPLFEIGNGSSPINLRNAMTVLKNGSLIIGSSQMDNDPAIADDDSRMFFNKTKSAFRAGLIQGTLGDDPQVGMYSVAFGRNNQAIGANSVALGENNNAIGLNAMAIGNSTDANGQTSLALGADTTANGQFSTAMNLSTTADALASTAIGRNNVGGGDPIDWIETDAIFEIGNAQDPNNKTNALTVLKNGTITAPSFDLSEITDDKALVTKEYLEENGSTGLEQITEESDTPGVFNTGWRLKGFDPANYGPIGVNAVDLSNSPFDSTNLGATGASSIAMNFRTTASGTASTAMGNFTQALGTYATAMGSDSDAIGNFSTAMGSGTEATGLVSTAMGNGSAATGLISTAMGSGTTASGDYSMALGNNTTAFGVDSFSAGKDTNATANNSTAFGNGTIALGLNSTSMGISTIANAYAATAIGKFNTAVSDGLFIVGNGIGTSTANRSNAFIIKEDGKTGINTSNPLSLFEVAHGTGTPTASNMTNALSIRNTDAGTSWQFYSQFNDDLHLYNNGLYRGAFLGSSGAYVQTSDKRVKKDIVSLDYGTLNKVMQLNPVSYLMKDQTDNKRNLGLISQEVQKIFPTLTSYVDGQDLLALSYTELIPVLIKALQEQQDIIETQTQKIGAQDSKNTKQDNTISALLQRIEKLEAINQ